MLFENREDAALQLLPLLERYRNDSGVVLAVPRGGVPLGYIVAKHFNFPLELLMTKKIGHPLNPELAIGAVSMEEYYIDPRYEISEDYIETEMKRIRESLKERYKKFVGSRKTLDLQGKTLIIVDDGIATGNTILATIHMLRQRHPKKIVVAVPVAPPNTVSKIRSLVDDFVCIDTPEEFYSIGEFYHDFRQVSDEEVIRLLSALQKVGNAVFDQSQSLN